MLSYIKMKSPVGTLLLAEDGRGLCQVELKETLMGAQKRQTPLLLQAEEQLNQYFAGKRRKFSLPLSAHGTRFQMQVWQALQQIPYGETRTYAQTAAAAGSPRAFRAAGMACNCNPLMIVVPCHRVIGKDGSLTGFGAGICVKQFLLQLEQKTLRGKV
ncbi:MAG: methylated-DNA--[protein]-cysteine S-methyltransferase [Oscillospiraceae bacterium]|nr:methylated-DNA--[protein]-cysteine S-methyltransferase [Oscillospiraceae bacterium]